MFSGIQLQELFRRFARWLKPNGLLLTTLASEHEGPGYTEDKFFGVTMYWSNFGIRTYRDLIIKVGFRIEREGVIGHGYQNPDMPLERHPFVFAVRE